MRRFLFALLLCGGMAVPALGAWHSVLQITIGGAPPACNITATTHTAQTLGANGGTTSGGSIIDTTGATSIKAWVLWSSGFGTTPPVLTDSKGNNWIPSTESKTSDGYVKLYYAVNAIVGTGHTFTVTGTASNAGIGVIAFSGVGTGAPRDQQNFNGITFSTPSTSLQTKAVVPVANCELIVTALTNYTDASSSDRTIPGFTVTDQLAFNGTVVGAGFAYAVQTTAASVNPTWSWPSNVATANTVITTFAPATGGGSSAYQGPGDLAPSGKFWHGERAYSNAKLGGKSVQACNASDVACADLSTDPITGALIVTAVGGSSCYSISCTVKIWYDQLGTSANDLTTATIAKRATLVPNCTLDRACLAFVGASGQGYLSTNAGTFAQPYSMSGVGRRTSGSGYAALIESSVTNCCALVDWNNDGINNRLYAGTQLFATSHEPAWETLQGVFNGGSSALVVNGAASGGAGGATSWSFPYGVGRDDSTGAIEPLTGNIGEVGGWLIGFTPTQYGNINTNQRAWYAF